MLLQKLEANLKNLRILVLNPQLSPQSTNFHSTALKSNLVLPLYLELDLQSGRLPSHFSITIQALFDLPFVLHVHSCQQKSIGLKSSKCQTGSDVRYSYHHNSSRFTFPIFAHSCRFSVLHSLQSITPRIY